MQQLNDRERLEREIPLIGVEDYTLAELQEESRRGADQYGTAVADIDIYCFFVGYARSGHSLLGAFLDAHSDIVMAHELDVLKFIEAGFDRRQVEYFLIENARRCAAAGRCWGPYSYAVEGQWQGKFRTIKVLGDKKGGGTTRRILNNKRQLTALNSLFERKTKFLHVVRNPFDTISSQFSKSGQDLFDTVRDFFELAETNSFIRDEIGEDRFCTVHYEDLVKDPGGTLTALGSFLGVGTERDYIDACSGILATPSTRSGEKMSWPPRMIELVMKKSQDHDFFRRYRFEN